MLMTSLAEIKSFRPCPSGWNAILVGQGKTREDNFLFPLVECIESNSISDVCWLLGKKKEAQILVLFAKACEKSVARCKSNFVANVSNYVAATVSAAEKKYDVMIGIYAGAAADAAVRVRRWPQNNLTPQTDLAMVQLKKNQQFLREAIINFRGE